MGFTDILGSLLPKKSDSTKVYVSLYLDVHSVAAAFWSIGSSGDYSILGSVDTAVPVDSWDARSDAADRLIGLLEEKTGHTDVTKAILGLPSTYLTPTGEIRKEVRIEIKNFTRTLELEPIGFVPLHQAVIYRLKKDEGVPPSVILLGVNTNTVAITVYKIGGLVGVRDIEKNEDIATSVETGLKSFTDLEVLPARMLLYGASDSELVEIKNKLMRHQWTSKVNFLHFPKIDIISLSVIIESVSLAGASELGSAMTGDEPETQVAVGESMPVAEDQMIEEIADAQETIAEDFATNPETVPTDDNVVLVDAESLGFKKDVDVLEEEHQLEEAEIENEEDEDAPLPMPRLNISGIFAKMHTPRLPIFIGVGVLAFLTILLYWFLPHATITVLEIPKIIESTETITIDPTATIVDAQNKIIPGKKREKSISGDKTIPVNGKKSIGDPARGTVTIYNKSLSSKNYKKGTILSSGSLQFTLDADVQVASASENVGSITFGKGDANITAVAIGTPSNLTASSEFSFKDVSTGVAIARNDKALAGGNSREVTVVSRADYDAFVKEVSEELVGKAKEELGQSVTGGEKLIDDTIKTTVTEKVFAAEIDQEATQLAGKLTLSVSGIAYSDNDIRGLLTTVSSDKIPKGYILHEERTTIQVTNVVVKKDGKISTVAAMKAIALPVLDIEAMQKNLAGKSIKNIETLFRSIGGVGGVEVGFRLSPTKLWLPINKKNITISVAQIE